MPEKQQKVKKTHKSTFWIVRNIYYYIIAAHIVFGFIIGLIYNFLSKTFNLKESTVVIILYSLVSISATILAIKWAIESIIKKSIVYPQEFLKISIWVGMIPIITIPILIDYFGNNIIITGIFSAFFYGISTYLLFKKLSSKR